MRTHSLPSPEVLRQLLTYDPNTGELYWRERDYPPHWNTKHAGQPAGSVKMRRGRPTGIAVDISGVPYFAHQLAWLMVHGSIPERTTVDHRNCNPLDNRLDNLRVATRSQQQANSRVLKKTLAGMKGVKLHCGKYQARIKIDGKSRHLGTFATAEQAKAAYDKAAAELFGEFARP